MESLLGFKPDVWDSITFGTLFVLVVAFLSFVLFILGLPGRIAIARKHPEAEPVNLMGWAGFMAIIPWIKALIWALKPTNVVDIRYFPPQEQEHIRRRDCQTQGSAAAFVDCALGWAGLFQIQMDQGQRWLGFGIGSCRPSSVVDIVIGLRPVDSFDPSEPGVWKRVHREAHFFAPINTVRAISQAGEAKENRTPGRITSAFAARANQRVK
jgi:hypothetical protein